MELDLAGVTPPRGQTTEEDFTLQISEHWTTMDLCAFVYN